MLKPIQHFHRRFLSFVFFLVEAFSAYVWDRIRMGMAVAVAAVASVALANYMRTIVVGINENRKFINSRIWQRCLSAF